MNEATGSKQKNWGSLTAIFEALLSANCPYIILRNFENIFDTAQYKAGSDIDFLCENKSAFTKILDAVRRDGNSSHYKILVDGVEVSIDIREVGDGYYCTEWEQDMLDTRILHDGGFYVMEKSHHYYSLIYHCIVHKGFVSETYLRKIDSLRGESRDEIGLRQELILYMTSKKYKITNGTDLDLKIHTENLPSSLVCSVESIRGFFTMLDEERIGYVLLPRGDEDQVRSTISVLLRPCDRQHFMKNMHMRNFRYKVHQSRIKNETFAYNTPPHTLAGKTVRLRRLHD